MLRSNHLCSNPQQDLGRYQENFPLTSASASPNAHLRFCPNKSENIFDSLMESQWFAIAHLLLEEFLIVDQSLG